MKLNDDELQKELKDLKTSASLDPQNKKTMKAAIRKHAKKKRKRAKLKKSAIWLSSAAALLISGVLVFNAINNNESVLPADDHDQSEYNDHSGREENVPVDNDEEEPADETPDSPEFSVNEQGTETQTIMLEGMEEDVTVTNYVLEPYGIQYQMGDFLGNYTVDDETVRHYSDADNAWITLEVMEDASLDDVVSDIQSDYGVASETEEPAETPPGEENQFRGIGQHFSSPPQGYYVYQIEENVLVIQYEYLIEAGDGMGPRLLAFRESIEQ